MMINIPTSSKNKPVIIGFPFDDNSSYMKGTALAPPLIRKALYSKSSNLWSETGIDLKQESILTDAGDLKFSPDSNAFDEIEKSITKLLNRNFIPVSLGGDHSITYPIIKAFNKKYPEIHILHLDAHPDLYNELEGNRDSHACPFARIMENGLAKKLTQVGIRTINGQQKKQAEKFGVEVIDMISWKDSIPLEFKAPVYISIDIDVLDPAFAPGVSHYEPGGLSTRQLITCIQNVSAPKIIGADIVEFNPKRDESGITAMVCAKILKETISKIVSLY
jgi:agmatinase